jgi:hypothetical protein
MFVRRGEETFLEKLEDKLRGHPLTVGSGVLKAQHGILLQSAVGLTLVIGVRHLEMLDDAFGKTPAAIPADFMRRTMTASSWVRSGVTARAKRWLSNNSSRAAKLSR